MNPLLPLLTAFPRVKVLVIGDLVADHYIYGQTERLSREAPVLIVRHKADEVKLGGGANAAANARTLGAQVTTIGVLGNDSVGNAMKAQFKKAGITLYVVSHKGVPTETKTRVLAGGQNTSRQQMLRIDRGHEGPLPHEAQKQLAQLLKTLGAAVDVVIVSDYGAGVLCEPVRAQLHALAKKGIPVCVDSRFGLSHFRQMHVCKPNEPELAALTGLPVATDTQLKAAAASALRMLKCDALLVTRGKNGMALFQPKKPAQFIPVWGNEEAVDVTGAGDTVSAAFAVSVGAGASFSDAAKLANVAGALVVQKQGTATVGPTEILEALSDA